MREIVQFRVDERFAPMLFSEGEGKRLGDSVRKVDIATDDPRFLRVGSLQAKLLQSEGKPFFYGWRIARKYFAKEIESAKRYHLRVSSVFEPAGEECGTKYDETAACARCGAGATQEGPLRLVLERIPKGKDFARTIAGEIVVSRRVADLFLKHGVSGASLHPVRAKSAKSLELSDWSQLVIRSAEAEIVAPTRSGNDPFDDDPKNEHRCPDGHLIGLNLLSEVSISEASAGELDLVATRQYVGARRGLLRPQRVVLISRRVWRLIGREKLKGCEIEVAHIV